MAGIVRLLAARWDVARKVMLTVKGNVTTGGVR